MRRPPPTLLLQGTVLTALLLCGCRTPHPPTKRLPDAALRPFFERARDPRRFWLTVYDSQRGPVFANADRLHHGQLDEVSFQPDQTAMLVFLPKKAASRPLIRFDDGKDQEFVALVDTSSERTWIDFDTAERLRATPLGPPAYEFTPHHVLDPMVAYASVVSRVRFHKLNVENFVVCVRAGYGGLSLLARGESRPRPVCVLGTDLLGVFEFVQLDYPRRAVVFSATSGYQPDKNRLLADVPLILAEGGMAVEAMVDGRTRTVMLDSAGDFEMITADPEGKVLRQIIIGDLVLRQMSLGSAADYGCPPLPHLRMGRHLLSRFVVTLVPKEKRVIFERPPK